MPFVPPRRSHHSFITTPNDVEPIGSYEILEDGDDQDIYTQPVDHIVRPGEPVQHISAAEREDIDLGIQSQQSDTEPDPLEAIISKAFDDWRRIQRSFRPDRKATFKFEIKARTTYKSTGRRGIYRKKRPVPPVLDSDSESWGQGEGSDKPKKKKRSKYYRYPSERYNQHPALRTFAALVGYEEAIWGHIRYLIRQIHLFEQAQVDFSKHTEAVAEETKKSRWAEGVQANRVGLSAGFYLCQFSVLPCYDYCGWPGCRGERPSVKYMHKIEMANSNINPADNMPFRVPLLFEEGMPEVPEGATPGSGFYTGFELNRASSSIHHTVRLAQALQQDKKYDECWKLCQRHLRSRDPEKVRPKLSNVDRAHLAFTAGGAARFACSGKWSLGRRITEIERHMNLSVTFLLIDSNTLSDTMNELFYADVKAKAHYWGEVHHLHLLMPQRTMSELITVLAEERYKRLVRLYETKKQEEVGFRKKGFTLQIFKIKLEDASKKLVEKRRGIWAKKGGGGGATAEDGRNDGGVFKNFIKSFWTPSDDKNAQGAALPEEAKMKAEVEAREQEIKNISAQLDLFETIRDQQIEDRMTWVSMDGTKRRRRQTPVATYDPARTIKQDVFHDYQPTPAYRAAAIAGKN